MEKSYVLQLSDKKFEDLYLCFCGYAECQPLHSFGPASRPNYLIHYIVDGKGTYTVGEKIYHLGSGQGFLIEPETMTFYQADKEEPWTYFWIGFSGKRAAEYVADLGINSDQLTFRTEKGNKLKEIVLEMLKNHKLAIKNQYLLQSLLYAYFATLIEDIKVEGDQGGSPESVYVKRAIGFIRNSYHRGIKVADIAQYVCISRSYLHMLFQKHLGMSPQEFLTKFRVSRAKELLTISELSIEEVAKSCGYEEALVFSKVFKKTMGVPPSVFRREHRKQVHKNLEEHQESIEEMMNKEGLDKIRQR
ncbi:MAG: AraC family transcriptional regulator [Lachnospiraceae bacterium]